MSTKKKKRSALTIRQVCLCDYLPNTISRAKFAQAVRELLLSTPGPVKLTFGDEVIGYVTVAAPQVLKLY